MDINSAIAVITVSDRTDAEKSHLRKLVFGGKLVPNAFVGFPNYEQILQDYPIECKYLILIIVPYSNFVLCICFFTIINIWFCSIHTIYLYVYLCIYIISKISTGYNTYIVIVNSS